ncbi:MULTISPECIES: hypothetical protein [Dehalobacter]|jgi:hypothetical protein|uniref:Lipoprotein n=2 Tax=Dehalobacter restrictus TaxID=55583 RepID=A0A857DHZ0_9FIRM|nr:MULTISPECIES: hypothetical protein [Dehalobacter]AHF09820.1 hypothetical protein DEHRE_06785 [Dehalobacter restrictus DSM 9455]MCG1026107.1 hypothetical protein [Dehalobacter sp.]MDJ0305034.1 hypothetical protein [Dehalobacter sp.]OCZ53441.1 hypothetical protein A7D23_07780 [Dehalobacter sp. TeCB1]QHA00403.1 hypothetical protein GQ588_07040 [Dehalobacter restrictus]
MIKIEKYRIVCGILFLVILVIILAACGNPNLLNKGEITISKDKDNISLKIENTKSISIHDIASSSSNCIVHITDPEIINQMESLFNKTSFIKCTDSIQTPLLYINFSNDSGSISFFVYANDIVDIDGIKYKSKDITFDAVNTFYLKKSKGLLPKS